MITRKMALDDAIYVCSLDRNSIENTSLINYNSPRTQAKELFDYSVEAWTVVNKGEPVAICGVSPLTMTTVWAWCISGTANRRVWVHLARQARDCAQRLFTESTIKRIHSYACINRPEAVRFLKKLGMVELCRMDDYGSGGRDFALMAVTKKEWG